jgi:hypothetical protein
VFVLLGLKFKKRNTKSTLSVRKGGIDMKYIEQKILDLPLKAQWYLMQESGEKTEEYREIKPYWSTRFLGIDSPIVVEQTSNGIQIKRN